MFGGDPCGKKRTKADQSRLIVRSAQTSNVHSKGSRATGRRVRTVAFSVARLRVRRSGRMEVLVNVQLLEQQTAVIGFAEHGDQIDGSELKEDGGLIGRKLKNQPLHFRSRLNLQTRSIGRRRSAVRPFGRLLPVGGKERRFAASRPNPRRLSSETNGHC